MEAAIAVRIFDLIIAGVGYFAARGITRAELMQEFDAADAEGRLPDVDKFMQKMRDAKARSDAHFDP